MFYSTNLMKTSFKGLIENYDVKDHLQRSVDAR